MKLNPIGPNQTEVELSSGTVVFFSYKTPVAAFIPGRGYIKTAGYFSYTTTKHVNQWLNEKSPNNLATIVIQSEIDSLI